ncbi:hypothetical protein IH679_26890, partial [Escherichia coli]|nr:hypothetical protein [Escherichia coli]
AMVINFYLPYVLTLYLWFKSSRREVNVPVEFIGFSIPDEFVVGYGIDYAQRYRHLPYIGKVILLDE